MPNLSFGQPVGGIVQIAYIVRDVDQSMKDFTSRLGVGPWFVTGPFVTAEGRYRGEPTNLKVTLAIGFAGHIMVELIQQHNDVPSVFSEVIAKRSYGFHHFAIASPDFDYDVARYTAMGYEAAFLDRSPRGVRIAYMDAVDDVTGMIELIEMTPALETLYTKWQQASVDWDGRDPVRKA
jgi:hypothetical protein